MIRKIFEFIARLGTVPPVITGYRVEINERIKRLMHEHAD